jgi:hypothetical protein
MLMFTIFQNKYSIVSDVQSVYKYSVSDVHSLTL